MCLKIRETESRNPLLAGGGHKSEAKLKMSVEDYAVAADAGGGGVGSARAWRRGWRPWN